MFPFIFLPRDILFYLWDLSFPGMCILSLNHAANKTESKPRVWGFQYRWYLMSYCSWKQQEGKLSTNPPQSYSANTELTKPKKVQTIHCAWNKWIPPTPTPSGCFSPPLCHNAPRSLLLYFLYPSAADSRLHLPIWHSDETISDHSPPSWLTPGKFQITSSGWNMYAQKFYMNICWANGEAFQHIPRLCLIKTDFVFLLSAYGRL